jgi:hypothetical protein
MSTAMTKTKWPAVLCMLVFAGASPARAQMTAWHDRGYASISVGVQPSSKSFTELSTPEIYGEAASITVPHTVGSGALFDLAGGARVWKNLAVGLGYSHFGDKESPTVAAQIPNPAFFSSPRNASTSAGELSHSENALHVQFLWMFPISSKVSVAAIVGPSFTKVKQDLVAGLTPVEGAPPFATVTIGSVSVASASAWAKGINVGVDGTYSVTPKIGAGLFVRFVGGSAELGSDGNTITVDAAGLQIGAGLRYRF